MLLSQWANAERRTSDLCWLPLVAAHDNAVVLAHDLVSVIQRNHQNFDATIHDLTVAGGRSLGPVFIDALAAEMDAVPEGVVLALDDVHNLTNSAIAGDLGRLLQLIPDNSRLLIASRWDPPIPVGRLRLEGRMVECRADDLAFDVEEGRQLIELVSMRTVPDEQVAALVARTDGWAAGLQLAAISLQRAADVAGFVAGFAGNDRLVADYLTEEVLRSLEPATRRFLIRTSVLEWLSPELCDAVTGDDDGRQMLDELLHRSLFVVPVPSKGGRCRYHPLFADLLRYQLRAESPSSERDLRLVAARWLLAHDELQDGIEQLLAAGERMLAFDVIQEHGHRPFERGEAATLVRWLTEIEASGAAASPRVAVNLLAAQVAADEFTAAAETYRRLGRRSDVQIGEQTTAELLYSLLGLGDLPTGQVRRATAQVLQALPRLDDQMLVDFLGIGGVESMETMALFMAAWAAFYDGDVAGGAAGFAAVLDTPGTKYPIWRINAHGSAALARAWTGNLSVAQPLAVAALETAQDIDALHHLSVTYAYLTLAMVNVERLDLTAAGFYLHEAARCTERTRRATVHHVRRLVQARYVAAAEGNLAALAVLRGPVIAGVERPLLRQSRRALEVQLLVAEGALYEAGAALQEVGLEPGAPQVDYLLATGDLVGARQALDQWRTDPADLRRSVEHAIREAVLVDAQGHPGKAGAMLADVVVRLESEELRRPLLEVAGAQRILKTSAPRRQTAFVSSLLELDRRDGGGVAANHQLVEPLTDRERAVLEYLPSRLTNGEIAATLYVSVNTLKSHLRSIYRKLDVTDRDGAVAGAGRIGLL